MTQDLSMLTQMYFVLLAISFWLLYHYSDLIHLDWIMMIVWLIIFPPFANVLVNDGWIVYLHFGGLILIEYLSFMHLLNNYQREKQRKNK